MGTLWAKKSIDLMKPNDKKVTKLDGVCIHPYFYIKTLD